MSRDLDGCDQYKEREFIRPAVDAHERARYAARCSRCNSNPVEARGLCGDCIGFLQDFYNTTTESKPRGNCVCGHSWFVHLRTHGRDACDEYECDCQDYEPTTRSAA